MKCPAPARVAFFATVFVAALAAADFTPEPGFVALFNGRDFTGWHHKDATTSGPALDGKTDPGDGRYTIRDGVLSGNDQKAEKGRVLLWTTKAFTGNFVLRFDFRDPEKTATSGRKREGHV